MPLTFPLSSSGRSRLAPLLALAVVATLAALVIGAVPASAALSGDYLEARTADVYTGPCFANGEMGLVGKEAILAWRVADGAWDEVDLAGLAVVAVVTAPDTLGDVAHQPGLAGAVRTVLLVDERADAAQADALVAFARSMGGVLVDQVERVEAAPISLEIDDAEAGIARMSAGEGGQLATIETRALGPHDRHCGNEIVFYDPLAPTLSAVPAATRVHRYDGGGLGKHWSSPDKRSAFVGRFAH